MNTQGRSTLNGAAAVRRWIIITIGCLLIFVYGYDEKVAQVAVDFAGKTCDEGWDAISPSSSIN